MYFNDWQGLIRLLIITPLAYVSMLLLLRASGNRTLSKLNAFDFVVTIALGSCLATVVLSKDVPLAEGALAFALLILLQYVVALLVVYLPPFRSWVKGEPQLLFHNGQYLDQALKSARVTKSDVLASIRKQGFDGPDSVSAVVLETNGGFSVIPKTVTLGNEVLAELM